MDIDTAAATDPNELSFKKGEVLQIFDKSGKWWEAQTRSGKTGSAYLYFCHSCFVFDYLLTNNGFSRPIELSTTPRMRKMLVKTTISSFHVHDSRLCHADYTFACWILPFTKKNFPF